MNKYMHIHIYIYIYYNQTNNNNNNNNDNICLLPCIVTIATSFPQASALPSGGAAETALRP